MNKVAQYLIVAGAVLTSVICCVGGVLMVANSPSSASSQANNAIATDTPYTHPTYPPSTPAPSTPAPTAAPSLVIYAPTIGGTIDDIQQRYGPATSSDGQ